MYDPNIKTANTVMSARYGFRFLPVFKHVPTIGERKALKRMKKFVHNTGKLQTVRMHTIDEFKLALYGKS